MVPLAGDVVAGKEADQHSNFRHRVSTFWSIREQGTVAHHLAVGDVLRSRAVRRCK